MELKTQSLVSVLLCTYNAEKYIWETVMSIINQSYPNIEILVLDNNSQDNTVDLLRKAQKNDARVFIYQEHDNLGAYPGFNYLLKKAQGEFIAIQDHDDLWHSQKIESQVDFLLKNQQFKGCGTQTVIYYEFEDLFRIKPAKQISNLAAHTSLMFRNEELRYDTSVIYKTDTYFMKKILCDGEKKIYNIQKPLAFHRIRSDGNNLHRKWLNIRGLLIYVRKAKDGKAFLFGIRDLIVPNKYLKGFDLHINYRSSVFSREYLRKNHLLREYETYLT